MTLKIFCFHRINAETTRPEKSRLGEDTLRVYQSNLEDKFQHIFGDIIENIRGGGRRYKREINHFVNNPEELTARVIFSLIFPVADLTAYFLYHSGFAWLGQENARFIIKKKI